MNLLNRLLNPYRTKLTKEEVVFGAVVNFCSNDYAFIGPCIKSLEGIAKEIIVPYCTKMFDGTEENLELIEKAKQENPNAKFIAFDYDPVTFKNAAFGNNLAREIGIDALDKKCNYIIFSDTDEIIDTPKLLLWLKNEDITNYNCIRLRSYWYFLNTTQQASTFENSTVIAVREKITKEIVHSKDERTALFKKIKGNNLDDASLNGIPMVHHYSWVRNRTQMLKKVRAWSHREERDWESLVNKMFDEGFNGTDFVHGYTYKTVEPYIQLD